MAAIAYLQPFVKANSRMFPRKRRRSAIIVSSRLGDRIEISAKDWSRPFPDTRRTKKTPHKAGSSSKNRTHHCQKMQW
jgi:hypothetical protein